MRFHSNLIAALAISVSMTATLPTPSPQPLSPEGRGAGEAAKSGAPLFEKLGTHHHPITTKSPLAQKYFDQGLILCYGFNHQEAIRSFTEATRIDPDCAMAYWGIAFAHGPNINAPMSDEAAGKAYDALQKALKVAGKVSKREQAYVQALTKRYAEKPPKERAPLDLAFANAMREVMKAYPDDLDAATLFAEALMDVTPWNYWSKDGQPTEHTPEIEKVLESVLSKNPNHPGANHMYIHAVEASPHPERGLPAARRLRDLVPESGHLVHMPAHIFLRVGMYHDATLANERAIDADETYITQCRAQGFYPTVYFSHNIHFLWYSASMEGRRADALRAARKTAAVLTDDSLHQLKFLHWLKATPLFALTRFGKWDDILKTPKPPHDAHFETAIWHYARGLAFVRQQRLEPAEAEDKALSRLADSKAIKDMELAEFPGATVTRIAQVILSAEVAGARGKQEDLLRGLEKAVELQDALPYMEPPFWHYPVRQSLGAALLQAGRFDKAEAVYREDLKHHPENGWALFGLMQTLRAQGRSTEADALENRFRDAWRHADFVLTRSSS